MRGGDRSGLGLWGEEQAARYLESQGYQVTASRYRCREGELDLVAEGKGYLCFVEVMLRKDHHLAQAREFVTPAKQRKVRIAAQYYLLDHPTQLQPRFDVIEVYAPQGRDTAQPEICHWENAF